MSTGVTKISQEKETQRNTIYVKKKEKESGNVITSRLL
jgi:hypothetical protein